ncbi:hypothetical protein NQ317_017476 [Molorchus minor]|uniref:Uncharacterized protein n=1 Tax=Molorchus minor TaxID=1323400 RepID=A0ABQ9JRF5_9CUCU|nr:hypothetical protein NQ317_017476 [Molorchus minor]
MATIHSVFQYLSYTVFPIFIADSSKDCLKCILQLLISLALTFIKSYESSVKRDLILIHLITGEVGWITENEFYIGLELNSPIRTLVDNLSFWDLNLVCSYFD